MSERLDRITLQQHSEQAPTRMRRDANGPAMERPVVSAPGSSNDLTSEMLREVLLEIRALADAAGHPCMMVNPEVVERLAEERLLARQRENPENAARPRLSA